MSPLATMRSYLGAMEGAHYAGIQPPPMSPPIVAALGPTMIGLAGQRGGGAHTYNSPTVHTAMARKTLGRDRFWCQRWGSSSASCQLNSGQSQDRPYRR